MQNILVEKPYEFIPLYRSTFWSSFIQRFHLQDRWLRKAEGVVDYEVRGADHLRRSLDAGHGILLTPNHARAGDPVVMGWLAREVLAPDRAWLGSGRMAGHRELDGHVTERGSVRRLAV